MNMVLVSGYANYVKAHKNLTTFKLSIPKRSKGEGRLMIPVKVFGTSPLLHDGAYCHVVGRFDSYTYNDKEYLGISVDPKNIIFGQNAEPDPIYRGAEDENDPMNTGYSNGFSQNDGSIPF